MTNIAPIDQACASDLSFVSETKFVAPFKSTQAGAVLTKENFTRHAPEGVAVLRIRKPYDAFVAVARKLYGEALRRAANRHRSAYHHRTRSDHGVAVHDL